MKKQYLTPVLEVLELETENILVGTKPVSPVDDPSKPLPADPFDE